MPRLEPVDLEMLDRANQGVLAVLFGCNLCYATPVAYQTNMLILTEGDYKFGDYLRSGIPLVAIMTVSLSVLLVIWYDI